jgi:signal peptidase
VSLQRVASWLITCTAAALVGAAVLVPRLAGATPYTVLTGSMAPAYPPGELVVVRPVPAEDIGVGDVITYQRDSGEATVVTHRVVAVSWTAAGEQRFTTRGDANDAVDVEPVRAVQVRGEVWYSLPWVGRLNVLFTGDQRDLLARVVGLGLVAYAGSVVLAGWRRRQRAVAT